VNWLEVGCPHCPSVLTLPRAAAGRMIRCPECDKSYLVPTPLAASAAAPAFSPDPVGASVSEESLLPSIGGAAYDLAPTVELTPPQPVATTERPAAQAPPPPKLSTPAPKQPERRRETVEAEAELAASSPLPEIPILRPPGSNGVRSTPPTSRPDSSQRQEPPPPRPPSPADLTDAPDDPPPAEPTASLRGSLPPLGPPAPSGRETTEEAQLRMHRAELRARINLAIFVIGTLVMIAFAWLVIRFSKPG
jgi:hypothetical protein